jgi:VWFA-related protein
MLNKSTSFLAFLLLFLIIPASFSGLAQSAESQNRFKAEVRLIQVEVRVDRDNQPVTGLNKDDFVLNENGREQEIAFLNFIKKPVKVQLEEDASSTIETSSAKQAFHTEQSWIYLLPEVGDPIEFRRTAQAIRKFVNQELPPGCYFSLGGLPYTDNKDLLLRTLDRLENKPYSEGSAIAPELLQIQMLEDLRRLVRIESSGGSSVISIDDESLQHNSHQGDKEPIAWVSRQIVYYNELAIFRYMDLIERMALLPGKKSVVLFRSGLRMDRENVPLMNRLLATAVKNRISFYTIDARGLVDSSREQPSGTMALAARGYRYGHDPMYDNRRHQESEEGLMILAEDTGGQVVLNNNNMGEILTRVIEDSNSYYVLSFYPETPNNKGKFRKINVSLRDQKGCSISSVNGYYDPKPIDKQSSGERLLSLKETMLTSLSEELHLSVEPEVFADPDGKPLLCLSVAVPAEDFGVNKNKKSKIEAELLVQVVNKYSLDMPLYTDNILKRTVTSKEFLDGGRPKLDYRTVLSLAPGYYQIKGIVRDKKSGIHGVYSSWIAISDFKNGSSVPSSLVLTKYAAPQDQANKDDIFSQVLSAGGNVYYPQADHEFRKGDVIYAMFYLYNATPEDFKWATKGVQVGLLQNGQLVEGLNIYGKPLPEPGSGVIRYMLMFKTAELEPGEYTFLAKLPNYTSRLKQQLEERLIIRE